MFSSRRRPRRQPGCPGQLRGIEVRVRDVHQDILGSFSEERVHSKVVDSVPRDEFQTRDLLSDQGAEGLIRLKSDLRSSPEVGHMAQAVGGAVLCGQNDRADRISCLYIVGGHIHLIISVGSICRDGHLRFRPGRGALHGAKGKASVLCDSQFLEKAMDAAAQVIVAVVRRLEKGIFSIVNSDRGIGAVPAGD